MTATAQTASADLTVAIAGPATVTVGQTLTYTITVRNNGPNAASNVILSDGLAPNNLTFVSLTTPNGWSCSQVVGGSISCTIASFADGSSSVFTIVANVTGGIVTPFFNQPFIFSTTPDPIQSNNLAAVATAVIPQTPQTITFGAQPARTFNRSTSFAISPLAVASSGLPIAHSSLTPAVCTVFGTFVRIVSAGTCTVAANQAGNGIYIAAPQVTQSIAINPAAQTITFGVQAAQIFSVGGAFAINPQATASSGLPVTYTSITPGICTVAGTTVTIVSAGACTIAANQVGDTNHNAALQVTQSVTISKGFATATLTTSSATRLIGEPATLTATVAPLAASGTVTFLDGIAPLCSAVALSNGTATCATSFTSGGPHSVTVAYNGNQNFASSTSAAATVTVTDQTGKTIQTIGSFLAQRNNQILSNDPDQNRQIERLNSAGGPGVSGGSGLTGNGPPSRLGSRFGASPAGVLDALDVMRLGSGRGPGGELPGQSIMDRDFAFGDGQGPRAPGDGGAANLGAVGFSGSVDGAPRLALSSSLADAQRQAADADRRKLEAVGLGFSYGSAARPLTPFNPFDIWVEGKYAGFHDTSGGDGHFALLTFGADYVFNRSLLAGVMIQFDSMRERSDLQATDISGQGWMIGPYATVRLTDQLFWQGRVAWGRSSNEVSPFQTYTDTFETERWLVATSVRGRWQSGPWGFRPSASVAYMRDTAESYRDTFGVLIPQVTSTLGLAKIGPEFVYTFEPSKGFLIEPHLGTQLIWKFNDSTTTGFGPIDGGQAAPSGARGRVELGVRSTAPSGLGVDVSGSYDGIGSSGYSAVTGRAALHMPF